MKLLYRVLVSSLLLLYPTSSAFAQDAQWQWTTPTEGTANVMEEEVEVPDMTVLINEVLPFPAADSQEYIELYNYGSEEISLKGWTLSDKSSVIHIFSDQDTVVAGGYMLLRGDFSLNQTSDEEVHLVSPTKEILDTFAYAKGQAVKGVSLSRMCDVYELRFCEVIESELTPGAVNKKISLNVSASLPEGLVAFGSKLELTSNNPDAKIFYSFSPDAPLSEALEYTKSISLLRDSTIYFFAAHEGQSSSIQSVSYSIEREQDTNLWLNEVFVSAEGNSWVEIHNTGKSLLDISNYSLRVEDADSKEHTLSFPKGASIYPTRYYVLTLPEDLAVQGGAIVLLSPENKQIGNVEIPSSLKGASMALTQFTDRHNVLNEVDKLYAQTDFPTKNKANIIAKVPTTDKDGDLLTEKEETELATDPEKFDTNKNQLPDFFDKGKEIASNSQKFLYKSLLSKLLFVETVWKDNTVAIKGKTLPYMGISIRTKEFKEEIGADAKGEFNFDFSVDKDEVFMAFVLTDQSGVSSFEIGPIKAEKPVPFGDRISKGQVIISAALPNPEGADTKDKEWVELKNTTKSPLTFIPTLQLGTTKKTLSAITLESSVPYRIYATDLGAAIPNSGDLALLQGTLEIDRVEYQDAKDGEILSFAAGTSVKVSSKSDKNTGKAVVKKLSTVSTLLSFPALAEVHVPSIEAVAFSTNHIPVIPKVPVDVQNPEKSYAIGLFIAMLVSSIGSFIWKW